MEYFIFINKIIVQVPENIYNETRWPEYTYKGYTIKLFKFSSKERENNHVYISRTRGPFIKAVKEFEEAIEFIDFITQWSQ